MKKLAENLARQIRQQKLLKPGDRVGAAVSGGADSVALLRLLLEIREELGIVLSVVHFHHHLRGAEADEDQSFVRGLAEHHGLDFHSGEGDVRGCAAEERMGLEASARKLRYQFFAKLLRQGVLTRVATGHTLDDQAETVLLRLGRGAGTRGLAGIHPVVKIAGDRCIVRPVLHVRRMELEAYLQEMGQSWREDASNRDPHYTRNRVRHEILPLLERGLNPSIREQLAATAEIARAEEECWDELTARALSEVWDPEAREIELSQLLLKPLALQRRVIRAAAEAIGLRLEFHQVERLLRLCPNQPGTKLELSDDWAACLKKNSLCFLPAGKLNTQPSDYSYALAVPGEVCVPEAKLCLRTELVSGAEQSYNSQHLFDLAKVRLPLQVRNWRAGDRFWPAHTKSPKKIKELLQEKRIVAEERKTWPVIVSGDEIIWVRGFSSPAHLRPNGCRALMIAENKMSPVKAGERRKRQE